MSITFRTIKFQPSVILKINVFLTFGEDFSSNSDLSISIAFGRTKCCSHRWFRSVIFEMDIFLTFEHDSHRNSDSPMSITSGRINFQPSSTTISNFENERLFDL